MLLFIVRRAVYMLVTVVALSVLSFIIIELPPGDYLTTYVAKLKVMGQNVDSTQIASLRKQYGLDLPIHQKYLLWISKILLHGDFGKSFGWNMPVSTLIAQRLPLTVLISTLSLLFIYLIAIPIGVLSATHQYSIGDYLITVVGFVGLSIPGFLFALILMFLIYKFFGISVGGLFSTRYLDAPWDLAKILDMLKHLVLPVIVVGASGTAGLIRVMRGCLLDELGKQYVVTARAKGVKERVLLYRYPVRVAINPIISTVGWALPGIVSGETITSVVLNLPTMGPLLLDALRSQDMYLAGSIVLLLSILTVLGTFISDILLVVVDPRIRFEQK